MRRRRKDELIAQAMRAEQAWQALGDILVAAGVIDPNAGALTGPEILNGAYSYIDYLDRLKR